MQFTEEHKALAKTVKSFCQNEIKPYIEDWEKNGCFPAHDLFKKMGKLDLLGITKSTSVGGLGLDYTYGMVFAESLGYAADLGVITAIGVQTDMATPALDRFGSKELKNEFLIPSISGDYVSAIAVSEPGAGSDVASIKTTAQKKDDDYVINGQKMWITNATQADYFCTLVNTGDGNPHKNKSLIIVPSDTKGLSIGDKIEKLGQLTSDTAPVYFDNVKVPQRFRIGEEGAGFKMQMEQFQEERIFISAINLIILDECISNTIEYCKQRSAFGKKLIENQSIHYKLAELQTDIESTRALIYQACDNYVHGSEFTNLASMAKLKSGRLIREVSDACLQFYGGMGFTWENDASKIYRDGRLTSIGGGADEVMLKIICKNMGILSHHK